jgi:hypothetical protein
VSSVAVEELVRLADSDWDAALEETGAPYRFSHRAGAGRAFEAAYQGYRYEPYRVRFRDGVTLLVPLTRVQRRAPQLTMLLGMPLGLEGRPVALEGEPAIGHVHGLFKALGGRGSLALNGGASGSPPGNGPQHATHTLDLRPGFEWLWEHRFSSKNRNSCRKGERSGVEVSRSTDVAVYFDLYARASRAWGYQEPPYPPALFSELLGSGHAELWLGRLEDRAIAGALLLRGSDDMLYWSGAVDAEHRTLAPGNLVIKTAIASACERGIGSFDFGASAGLPGVAAFKESFGASEVAYRSVELSSRTYRVATKLQRAARRVRPGR